MVYIYIHTLTYTVYIIKDQLNVYVNIPDMDAMGYPSDGSYNIFWKWFNYVLDALTTWSIPSVIQLCVCSDIRWFMHPNIAGPLICWCVPHPSFHVCFTWSWKLFAHPLTASFSRPIICLVVFCLSFKVTYSFIRSFGHLFIDSFIYSFVRSLVHISFICSLIHAFVRLFIFSIFHCLVDFNFIVSGPKLL